MSGEEKISAGIVDAAYRGEAGFVHIVPIVPAAWRYKERGHTETGRYPASIAVPGSAEPGTAMEAGYRPVSVCPLSLYRQAAGTIGTICTNPASPRYAASTMPADIFSSPDTTTRTLATRSESVSRIPDIPPIRDRAP